MSAIYEPFDIDLQDLGGGSYDCHFRVEIYGEQTANVTGNDSGIPTRVVSATVEGPETGTPKTVNLSTGSYARQSGEDEVEVNVYHGPTKKGTGRKSYV